MVDLILTAAAFLCVFQRGLCAFAEPYWNSSEFDAGEYGIYELQEYGSFRLPSPRANIIHWDPLCEYGYTLLTPRGVSVKDPGPMIIDGRGNLIWTDDRWGKTANLQIQTYKGEEFLTFWAGEVVSIYGKGSYFMVDSSYEVRYNFEPDGEIDGDLHEFTITPEGTALITSYPTISWPFKDIGLLGREGDGYIVDNVLQEFDIETGKKIFEWRATDHFPVRDTLMPVGGLGRSQNNPFDFFHLNSISKDQSGNFWVSARHFCAIFCISSRDGSILHTFGGRKNGFQDLSDGAATNISWQHHMNWHFPKTTSSFSNERHSEYITIFDNAAFNDHPAKVIASRALVIRLDMSNASHPTAELIKSYKKPTFLQTISQGSVQILPPLSSFKSIPTTKSREEEVTSELRRSANETVFVGWGQAYAWTEYDAQTGRVLCDVHLGASKHFQTGYVKSYRSYKRLAPWKGKPKSPPSIGLWKEDAKSDEVAERKIYASWNGATEVRGWLLQGSEEFLGAENKSNVQGWTNIATLPREGFEVAFDLDKLSADGQSLSGDLSAYNYFRVLALPEALASTEQANHAKAMGITGTLELKNGVVIYPTAPGQNPHGQLTQLTDKNGHSQDYWVLSAVHTAHSKPTMSGLASVVSNTPLIVTVVVLAGLAVGVSIAAFEWLKARAKRRRQPSLDKYEKQGLLSAKED